MGAVGGCFTVSAEEVLALQVEQVFDAFVLQLVKGFSEGDAIGAVANFAFREEPCVGEGAVFDKQDRCVRVGCSQLADEWGSPFCNRLLVHVRQAVDGKCNRVEFSEQSADFRLHASVSRKAQVSRWSV